MPQKISERDVCKRIVDSRKEILESFLGSGKTAVGYSRRNFESDMLSEGFISSGVTVETKWRMLKADGVVTGEGRRTELSIPTLYIRAGLPIPAKALHTNTHKHTQTGEASE